MKFETIEAINRAYIQAVQASIAEINAQRVIIEQAQTDTYLDTIEAQQDITELQLQILEGK